jgi:hypothetical protein
MQIKFDFNQLGPQQTLARGKRKFTTPRTRLHKNIRADSVMFFPEHVSATQEDRYEVDVETDISNPILMGYIFSRPDDVIQKPLPSVQRTDNRRDGWSKAEQGKAKVSRHSSTMQRKPDPSFSRHSSAIRRECLGLGTAASTATMCWKR